MSLNRNEKNHGIVVEIVADRPLLDVESNRAGPNLFLTSSKELFTHGTGGVLFVRSLFQASFLFLGELARR